MLQAESRKSNCSTPGVAWSSMKAVVVGSSRADRSTCEGASSGEPPRGRTVRQMLRRRQWRSFWGFLRNRYVLSIYPGCYVLFTRMLNDCYMSQAASVLGLLSLPKDCHPKKNPAPVSARSQVAGKFVARSTRRAASGEVYLFFRNLRGRTTQATNSKTKAPAAAIAIILPFPPQSLYSLIWTPVVTGDLRTC